MSGGVCAASGDDAEVLVVGLHDDVGAVDLYLVFPDAAFDALELTLDRDAVGDREPGEEALAVRL